MINWSGFKIVGSELEYLNDAFKSGWVSGGPYIEKLESELESIFSCPKALTVSNGTAALQLAFQTLGVNQGDHVIVPSFGFQAAGNVLRQLGATPVFCDTNPINWNQSLNNIKAACSQTTVGIVIIHNYGVTAPVDEICQWAKQNGVWVVEDCAEAWFSKHKGRYAGTYGDIATFSMHATKTISCGEGGAVLINDQSLIDRAQLLRSHGLDRTKVHYLHQLPGNNYRLSNLLAAIAYAQLQQRDSIAEKQKENAKLYFNHLRDEALIQIQNQIPGNENFYWAIAINICFEALDIDRDELLHLLKENNIEARPGFYPASALDYNNDAKLIFSSVSDHLSKSIVVLPCSLTLTPSELEYICGTLLKIIDAHRISDINSTRIINTLSLPNPETEIDKFYSNLSEGRVNFRYFDKRDFSIIRSHLTSLLVENKGQIIGYGHLEQEDGIVWLGIAIADDMTGKGLGKIMLYSLLSAGIKLGINRICLRVDLTNYNAIKLYQSFGFLKDEGANDGNSTLMVYEN